MSIQKYVRYLFGILFFIFIFNKFYLRPWFIENETPAFLQTFVFSIPNFIEVMLGTFLLTGILLQLRQFINKLKRIKNSYTYIIAVSISSFYVISQELKFHNLGGNNVYDFYDLVASFIGLILAYITLTMFGFEKEQDE